jgi:Skp family chaperone for outer membrane proteins
LPCLPLNPTYNESSYQPEANDNQEAVMSKKAEKNLKKKINARKAKIEKHEAKIKSLKKKLKKAS